ncbi:MAG: ASKHA domain-containing protein, partial [bacterium]|nr:ASKHA domain-containing protein [bacterium]
TMIHLLLGLKPEYIRLEPYTPTLLETPNLKAGEISIEINPEAYVQISPAVGSYVGGDITAGLLCTDIASDSEAVNLFLDIGTNGELVIGNRDFLLACACSAGPAFEGGGIKFGMRAAFGAIEGVEVERETGKAFYWTIGNVKPKGICGSGIISLLANLFLTGWIDAAGKLNRVRSSPFIQFEGRQARYIIVPSEESSTGEAISLSELEIDNIIRAKAAIYSACSLMLRQVGLNFDDLANIYIAGGFGRFIDLEKAITIGMLPDLPLEKFKYIGNASLMGSYLVLISQESRQKQIELAKRMTYLELSTDPTYMEQYTGALFLPHTNEELFPNICRVLNDKAKQ